jgi:hypothetical protein
MRNLKLQFGHFSIIIRLHEVFSPANHVVCARPDADGRFRPLHVGSMGLLSDGPTLAGIVHAISFHRSRSISQQRITPIFPPREPQRHEGIHLLCRRTRRHPRRLDGTGLANVPQATP